MDAATDSLPAEGTDCGASDLPARHRTTAPSSTATAAHPTIAASHPQRTDALPERRCSNA